ncbi:MAG: efflux RND transporter periplasmic adaptor subunit [Melioribacteraceae bacterium]|nr:efflux RND transporter periplasmic adaptor subunit [Melioribacteraceae bacterium]
MKNKKKLLFWLIPILLIAVLAIPKISGEDSSNESQSTNSNSVEVEAMIISSGELNETFYVNASILGDEEIELRPEAAGKVVSINFNEGSKVNKGDLLVKINDSDLQAQLLRAESQKKLAEEKEYRAQELLEQELISQEDYDVINTELNSRNAEIELLKAQIEKTEIIAPFDGIIGLRSVSEGAIINSSVVVAQLIKTDPVKIDFSLPVKHASKVQAGDRIKLTVPNSDKEFTAAVYAVDPKIDPASRTLKVRAKAKNPNGELIPGSYAEIEFALGKNNEAIVIPSQAIVPDIGGELVYIYKNGKAFPFPVEIGLRTNNTVEILNGVSVGDTLITSAIIQMRPGLDVKIRNFR